MKKFFALIILLLCLILSVSILSGCFGECLHPNWTFDVKQDATCTEEGWGTFKCPNCGLVENQSVPAKGHKRTNIGQYKEPTCQREGITAGVYCSVCQEVLEQQQVLPIVEHSYVDGKCKWCDDTKTYYITFMANGEVVAKVSYTANDKTIKEPSIHRHAVHGNAIDFCKQK